MIVREFISFFARYILSFY